MEGNGFVQDKVKRAGSAARDSVNVLYRFRDRKTSLCLFVKQESIVPIEQEQRESSLEVS